jgi:hypothetical protein
MRARDHIKERELLDWAETLLCNAECPKHCKPDEWREILKRWRDEKHGVSPNDQLTDRRWKRALAANPASNELGASETDALSGGSCEAPCSAVA